MFRNAEEAANSIAAIIKMLAGDDEVSFRNSVRSKLQEFNPAEISAKQMPSGAHIGSALTLTKSFLNGLPESFVADTITLLIGKL